MKATAYVDGSFNPAVQKYAFGCVCIRPDGSTEEFNGSGDNPDALRQRNVAGEMIASMLALKWAYTNHYDELEICYDYAGIEAWYTGAWKAKTDLTRQYREYMHRFEGCVSLKFTKITAHTGDTFNERADRLAKAGLEKPAGLPEIG